MSTQILLTFILTNLALNVTPGPAVMLVSGHAMRQGWRSAQVSILGILTGNALYCFLSAAGLGAILLASPQWFDLLRYPGALYLVWLACQRLWRLRARYADDVLTVTPSRRSLFKESLLLQLSNPKSLLFFCSLLPVFASHIVASGSGYILLLGMLAIGLEYPVLLIYSLICASAAGRFSGIKGRWRQGIDAICALLLLFSASLVLMA
ncbi:LysE family translocator [Enterobacter cloacae]|uniref:LysE family translocator n=1 Tax=Enterobacter cloacae TaxID=550 RepID=UPI002FF6236F